MNVIKFEDRKGRKSKKDRQYNGLKIEETKGVIRRRKSNEKIQYISKKKRDKQRSTKHYT